MLHCSKLLLHCDLATLCNLCTMPLRSINTSGSCAYVVEPIPDNVHARLVLVTAPTDDAIHEWYLKQKHSVDMSLVTLTGGKIMTIDVPISDLTKTLGPNWQNEWTCRHCHKRMCKMSKCKDCDAHY